VRYGSVGLRFSLVQFGSGSVRLGSVGFRFGLVQLGYGSVRFGWVTVGFGSVVPRVAPAILGAGAGGAALPSSSPSHFTEHDIYDQELGRPMRVKG